MFIFLLMKGINEYVRAKVYCVIHNIYRDIYNNSKPKGDWDSLIKEYSSTGQKFWDRFYMSSEKKNRIIKKHLNNAGFSRSVKFYIEKLINTNY